MYYWEQKQSYKKDIRIKVNVTTVDNYVNSMKLEKVNLLKIDV